MNARAQHARQIVELPDYAKFIGNNKIKIRSQTDLTKSYIISKSDRGLVCECPDHQNRKSDCKHIKIALELIRKNEGQKQTFRIIERSLIRVCKFCDSGNIVKAGLKKNKSKTMQRFKCQDCKKRFTANFGFEKMRYDENAITGALQMSYSGMSTRDISNHYEMMGIEVSDVTIYNWIDKYSKMTSNYLKGIVPRVSETWRTDEIFIKISGNQKLQYSMLDHETRFMITQYVANTKGTENVDPMFREAMMIADKIPTTLISDGAHNFHEAWKNNYKAKNPLWKDTEHIRHIHMKGDKNNNRMERLNGTIRDREAAYRGIKKMDSPLFDGFQTFYNFSKKHGGINNKTPAEKAGILVDGDNKWKTIIQNASLNKNSQ